MNEELKLSSPWERLARQLEALFAQDPAVRVSTDFAAEEKTIRIYVDGDEKAGALSRLLPKYKVFGNVQVKLCVVPANGTLALLRGDLSKAFAGNPALLEILPATMPDGSPSGEFYAVFEPRVVQFWADNLASPEGVVSTLYEELARELLTGSSAAGIRPCTGKVGP